jgi:hypothetical protein
LSAFLEDAAHFPGGQAAGVAFPRFGGRSGGSTRDARFIAACRRAVIAHWRRHPDGRDRPLDGTLESCERDPKRERPSRTRALQPHADPLDLFIGSEGDSSIDAMRAVKRALDPQWKLAPGVLFSKGMRNEGQSVTHCSFLIAHSSFLIPHSSFLVPHSSFLVPHSSFLIPRSSFLIAS